MPKPFRVLTVGVVPAVLMIFSGLALAQPPAAGLDKATRQAVVEKAAAGLRARYVFPDVGDKAAARIEAQLAAGAYDDAQTNWAFAAKLTADLRDVTHDKHLNIGAPGGPPPSGAPMGPPPRNEAGVVRADQLAGGIGYVEVLNFPPPAIFKPAIDRAMATVADAPALIIDVRRNNGGSPDSVAYLVSYFVDPGKRMLINDFHNRKPGTTEYVITQTYSQPTPKSFLNKPVYVLTSNRTFSGGEELSYDMQAFKLGTLIGETTGGGANPGGGGTQLPAPFSIFMPTGRPINPVTKTNWEGVGVIPDVAVPPADALKVALQRLKQNPASGDIAVLSQARLFEPRSTRQPGSEAALRGMVDDLMKGAPRYETMSPSLGEAVRQQLPGTNARFATLGPLEKVVFMEVAPSGADSYELKFANGVLGWEIALSPDGKIANSRFRNLPAMTPTAEERMGAYKSADKNGDGKLDKAEYLVLLQTLGFAAQIDTLFAQRDVDRDGFVTAEEYRTVIPQ